MTRFLTALLLSVLGVAAMSGCVIDRKAECIDADACDQALDEPFGDFDVADPTFGDLGTCWQTEDTAAPCVRSCDTFRADQQALALELGRDDIFEACGGVVE